MSILTPREAAIEYVTKRGWGVIATSPGSKIPVADKDLQPNGSKSWTKDLEVIEKIYNDVKGQDAAGELCDYIPALQHVSAEDANRFGIVVCDLLYFIFFKIDLLHYSLLSDISLHSMDNT